MRLACYARLSREDRGSERIRIPDQLEQCRARAAELGAEIVAEHADDGISGTLDERHRPGLLAVLALAEARSIDCLIVRDQSRLARGEDLLGHLRTLLARAGVRLESVLEARASDLERGVRAVIDAEYVRRCRELSRLKGRAQAARGERLGGRPPHGYRWEGNELLIVPEEARTVARAYALALDGASIRRIGLALGWPFDRVARTLRSPWYTGDYVYGRTSMDHGAHDQVRTAPATWTVIRDHHEPIIPRADWQKVQSLLGDARGRWSSGHPPGTGARLPLSGLLRCGVCGGGMSVSGMSHPSRHGRERWHYYACFAGHIHQRCEGVGYRSVRGWVPRLLASIAEIYTARDLPRELHAALAGERARSSDIPRLERECARLLAAIRSGQVRDLSRLASELDAAQQQLELARAAEAHVRSSARPVPSVPVLHAALLAAARYLRQICEEPPPEISRPLLHRHLRQIEVSRDAARIEVECGAVLGDSVLRGCPGVSLRRLVVWRLGSIRQIA